MAYVIPFATCRLSSYLQSANDTFTTEKIFIVLDPEPSAKLQFAVIRDIPRMHHEVNYSPSAQGSKVV